MGCRYGQAGCGCGFEIYNPRKTRTRGMGLLGFDRFVIYLQKKKID